MSGSLTQLPLAGQIDDLLTCVHCGFCLPACPTYELLGDENDSPRGRLYLMRAVAEGRLAAADTSFALHLDRCLGCRACEPVCPSGVRYGFLLEHAREARGLVGGVLNRLARGSLDLFFGRLWLQNAVWALLRAFRATRLPELLARLGWPGRRPGRLRFAMAMLAATTPKAVTDGGRGRDRNEVTGPRAIESEEAERVAHLEGCVMAGLFGHVNRATVRLIRAHGAHVASLPAGLCCGAIHAHAGELEGARTLARRAIAAFEETGAELLLTNSAGCGAALKDYGEWFKDDPGLADRAQRTASRIRDVSEWLAGRSGPKFRALQARLGYDAPCHLLHAQRIEGQPLESLRRIPDLDVVPLPRSDRCCGGAGIYGLMRRRLSDDLLQRKLAEMKEVDVTWLLTGNPGCLMQIGAGALTQRTPLRVFHPVELLDAQLEDGSGQ